MPRTLVVVVWGVLVGGCSGELEMTATGTSGDATTSDGASETGVATTTDASTSTSAGEVTPTTSTGVGTADDSGSFVAGPDGGTIESCNIFAQDCPDGEKCAAWAEGGGNWNALKCVPVMGDQKPGEPCTAVGGGVSGLDDCVEGAMCWDVDEQGKGTCIEVCSGSERMPVCSDPLVGCSVSGDSVLALCLPICEPLVQDCNGDDLCLPIDGGYTCVTDGSGDLGAAFDPCEFVNGCDKGLICIDPSGAAECDQGALGCCSPMCSLELPACPGVGQMCLPVYEPQPPGFEDIGYCAVMR